MYSSSDGRSPRAADGSSPHGGTATVRDASGLPAARSTALGAPPCERAGRICSSDSSDAGGARRPARAASYVSWR